MKNNENFSTTEIIKLLRFIQLSAAVFAGSFTFNESDIVILQPLDIPTNIVSFLQVSPYFFGTSISNAGYYSGHSDKGDEQGISSSARGFQPGQAQCGCSWQRGTWSYYLEAVDLPFLETKESTDSYFA